MIQMSCARHIESQIPLRTAIPSMFADYLTLEPGCRVVAYDLTPGRRPWKRTEIASFPGAVAISYGNFWLQRSPRLQSQSEIPGSRREEEVEDCDSVVKALRTILPSSTPLQGRSWHDEIYKMQCSSSIQCEMHSGGLTILPCSTLRRRAIAQGGESHQAAQQAVEDHRAPCRSPLRIR